MAIDARWTRVLVDDRRSLLYGPGTGRLYLLEPREAEDPRLRRVLGLARSTFAAHLDDPAAAVAHDAASLRGSTPPRAPARLRAAYRLLDRTRSALPFGLAVRLAAAAGRRRARGATRDGNGAVVDAIALAIHALERDVGYADCYPRALLTAFLALAAGSACRIAIGVLAPTRKMHAWCTVDGVVPYEPMPEHYLYRPLLVVSLDP
ncbi:MAG TPA: lasso peptide biosynthesis B2 protein [Burkholderiales bacterium]